MDRNKMGMLAKSLAGHDAGKVYLIIRHEKDFLYLVDGKIRPLAKPKKKRMKHVQLICKQYDLEPLIDSEIVHLLREYNREND